eukprot:TRINITY_DN1700_c0_g1_i1.p1 TRINITY_DN1700_c0_g1~~TRINITY_DN1700_c0_g1_i1.p1  ORF type:complete len:395 (+),score=86.31 TRINITY_DN1700_c0_g1_i1:100-1284(+)
MAQVAPEQMNMTEGTCPKTFAQQPKIPGNGCCCRCCGASPKEIKVEDIKRHGNANTRWIQKPDGRVIEYYVYGSDKADARIFVQINGSMGSAKFFSELPPIVKVLTDKNVKAIAVNVPGHGFTSGDPLRRMGEWAKSEVEPVLKAEKVPDDAPLMVEGSSFGAAHAQSVFVYFQDRITHAHFHVPALSEELSKELTLPKVSEGCSCTGDYATTCFLKGRCCSPCFFCCCSCVSTMMAGQANEMKKLEGYSEISGANGSSPFEMSEAMKHHSLSHSIAANIHGPLVYNIMLGQLYRNWGFHPFDDVKEENVERMKIMISYGEKDTSSPESHGEYMANFYSKKCNKDGKLWKNAEPSEVLGNATGGKCLVNYAPNGHMAHFVSFCKGELMRKLLEL